MFKFNIKNKLMSILLLFVMIFQVGVTSTSFAMNREETLDISNYSRFNELTKAEIHIFMKLLNDPEIRNMVEEIESMSKNGKKSRYIHWRQTDDFLLGFWDAISEKFNGMFEDAKSLLDYQTYKALMDFCFAIFEGEITIETFEDFAKSELRPVKYVLENTVYIMHPDTKPSNGEVREYAENLCETIILIMDAKSTLKNMPKCLSKYDDVLSDLKKAAKKIDKNAKKPDIDLDFIEDNIVNKKKHNNKLDDIEDAIDDLAKKMAKSNSAKKWGVAKDGKTNQGVKHFNDYWIKDPDRIPSIATRLGIDADKFTNNLDGFENFTDAALDVVENADLKKIDGKKAYYYVHGKEKSKKGVLVITYDGKLQSMMGSSEKYFNKQ